MVKRRMMMRTVIVAVIVLIGWVFLVSTKELERNRRIQEEVSALEQEAAKIARENATLAEKISYFSSSDFREQEAKQKLGLRKPDETVVVIRQAPGQKNTETSSEEISSPPSTTMESDVPNYKKWWNIFFTHN